mmetsp:Transcript_32666/g.87698  ORF Transcript_32666/g.87698 Transcript_32666/m.87698 type:complete len:244 (+) Transcript_32666:1238-1969(+)
MNDWFSAEHANQRETEDETRQFLPFQKLSRHKRKTIHSNEVFVQEVVHKFEGMCEDDLRHAEKVDEDPAAKNGHSLDDVVGSPTSFTIMKVLENCLAGDEDAKGYDQPHLAHQEPRGSDVFPHDVRQQCHHWVTDKSGILGLDDPLKRVGKAATGVDEQMFYVIIDSPLSTFDHSRTPDESIEEHWQESWRLVPKSHDDIGVTGEELVSSVVVSVSVSANGEKVHKHRGSCLQFPTLERPREW